MILKASKLRLSSTEEGRDGILERRVLDGSKVRIRGIERGIV
jgi:hypothetical protein